MKLGSVCSGIEAASVGWSGLPFEAAFLSEIDQFPRAILRHHYPDIPLHGDFTTIKAGEYDAIDLLVGGTPCQSFSVAGLRKGFADERGNLTLEFLRLAQRLRPKWLVWENVPGLLSINEGQSFGSFLGGLAELGYGFAYRVCDAQWFGVAQRRRRIFVVGYLGDWRPPAAVLFERESLSGNTPPSRKARQAVAALTANGVGTCGADDNQGQAGHLIPFKIIGGAQQGNNHAYETEVSGCLQHKGLAASDIEAGALIASTGDVAHCLNAGGMGRQDYETETLIAHTLKGEGFDASEDGTGRGTPIVAQPYTLAVRGRANGHALEYRQEDGTANAILTPNGGRAGIGVGSFAQGITIHGTDKTARAASFTDVAGAIPARTPGSIENSSTTAVLAASAVRRLTPRECERLQGFPDDYTLIPYRRKMAADGPRYKALGNSMAVPVMAWIGGRINKIQHEMTKTEGERPV